MLDFQGTSERPDAASFLKRHWHKQALWMPGAVDLGALPLLEPDELAWLATQEDVESRLIVTERTGNAIRYQLRAGPFLAHELEGLPDRDWTLLVQDVEKHLPELRAWFELVNFIPDWRIDDLMISVAAPGGSVGPHVDNYDVFLVQALGRRHWQWTAQATHADTRASADLCLVERFEAEESCIAQPGDVLYLPPGVAHHGVAADLCVTCSIGMRAPELSDLSVPASEPNNAFYSDADLQIDEVRPGFISPRAVARVEMLLADRGMATEQACHLLGRFATLPKEWLRPESPGFARPDNVPLAVHGMARLAWSSDAVFANGHARPLPDAAKDLLEALCASRHVDSAALESWLRCDATRRLLDWLWQCCVFEPPDLPQE